MVEANLSGLRKFLCENVGGIQVGKNHQTIDVYPFLGDPKAKLAKNDVVGFDINNDGRLDGYIATTSAKLDSFVEETKANPRKYEAPKAWGAPVVISQERLHAITDHCQEVTGLHDAMVDKFVLGGLGAFMFVAGLGLKSSPLVIAGAASVVIGIIAGGIVDDNYGTAFSNMHHSLKQYLP